MYFQKLILRGEWVLLLLLGIMVILASMDTNAGWVKTYLIKNAGSVLPSNPFDASLTTQILRQDQSLRYHSTSRIKATPVTLAIEKKDIFKPEESDEYIAPSFTVSMSGSIPAVPLNNLTPKQNGVHLKTLTETLTSTHYITCFINHALQLMQLMQLTTGSAFTYVSNKVATYENATMDITWVGTFSKKQLPARDICVQEGDVKKHINSYEAKVNQLSENPMTLESLEQVDEEQVDDEPEYNDAQWAKMLGSEVYPTGSSLITLDYVFSLQTDSSSNPGVGAAAVNTRLWAVVDEDGIPITLSLKTLEGDFEFFYVSYMKNSESISEGRADLLKSDVVEFQGMDNVVDELNKVSLEVPVPVGFEQRATKKSD